ncbi:MAG: exodeoxyribonuclease VII large subunit [Candidatus Wallbacteria bacterium]|nr:exodeoxyribonuclease VII large subunit [Candidatus Wallbacteria bacterium]
MPLPSEPRDVPAAAPEPKILRVGELTRQIKDSLEGRFAGVWIEGEISNFTRAASGHCYFSVKDEEASIRGVMFRGSAERLQFAPENGLQVRAYGDVTVYAPRGEYNIRILKLMPAGIGALQLAFEQLKKKLQAEGLFEQARKRKLPFMPRTIGVVTSPTGAAIRDILKVLRRRFPNVSVTLCPCKVQGDGAAAEIAAAVKFLNEIGGFDVLIVGRGGGALEDLWAFNEEVVARAIASSAIPTISAVGHEVDFTIADFVADVRAPTPSAAAEMAVPDRAELVRRVDEIGRRLERAVVRKSQWLRDRTEALAERSLFRRPRELVEQHSIRLDELAARMTNSVRRSVELKQAAFVGAINRLEPVSPLKTMLRGYSILTRVDDTRPLTDATELLPGELVQVRMAVGAVACQVTDVFRETPGRGEQGRLPLA